MVTLKSRGLLQRYIVVGSATFVCYSSVNCFASAATSRVLCWYFCVVRVCVRSSAHLAVLRLICGSPRIGFFPIFRLHPWPCFPYLRALCQLARRCYCCSNIVCVGQLGTHFSSLFRLGPIVLEDPAYRGYGKIFVGSKMTMDCEGGRDSATPVISRQRDTRIGEYMPRTQGECTCGKLPPFSKREDMPFPCLGLFLIFFLVLLQPPFSALQWGDSAKSSDLRPFPRAAVFRCVSFCPSIGGRVVRLISRSRSRLFLRA